MAKTNKKKKETQKKLNAPKIQAPTRKGTLVVNEKKNKNGKPKRLKKAKY